MKNEPAQINTRSILVQAVKEHSQLVMMLIMVFSSWVFIASTVYYAIKTDELRREHKWLKVEYNLTKNNCKTLSAKFDALEERK